MSAMTPSAPEHALQQNNPAFYPPTLRVIHHMVGFLQWRFSLLPAGAYHWAPEDLSAPDVSGSEIYIAADTTLPSRTVGDRPAISVLRSQLAFQGVGIGDLAFHNQRTGGKTYMDLLPTTLCINVLSRLPFVAERLAWFVQDQIWTLREEIIRTEKCILSLGPRTTMAPPSPAGALTDSTESDWIVVPLFLPTYLQHTTTSVPLNVPVLKKIGTSIGEADPSKKP